MDVSEPPRAKRPKRSGPSAEEREKQFSGDLYADGGLTFFFKFSVCSADFTGVHTVKDKK